MNGDIKTYLASPNTQQQAEHAAGMDVLLSFAIYCPWMGKGYWQSFRSVLLDSGAFSVMNSGEKVDVMEYKDFSKPWTEHADAIAGLDDIEGDWQKSLKNYEAIPWSFPTIHDTDPPELLKDLVELTMKEGSRGRWLGIGLKPPREGKEKFVRWVCDNIPDEIHVHGWALRRYTHVRRLNSVDSTNWWRDAMKLRTLPDTAHLNYGECLDIVIKRYQRWTRVLKDAPMETAQLWEQN